jgi:hypothetical protein
VSVPDLARSFGGAAEAYERGRPGYAEAALDAVGLSASAWAVGTTRSSTARIASSGSTATTRA